MQVALTVAVAVAAIVVHKAHAAILAQVAAASRLLAHRVHVVLRVKVGKVPDVDVHRLETHNRIATKAVLPVAAWVSRALPAQHPVANPTRCEPASI